MTPIVSVNQADYKAPAPPVSLSTRPRLSSSPSSSNPLLIVELFIMHISLSCNQNISDRLPTLCHKSSFNPCCNVHGFFFLKTFYVSLIYKCRIVLKIFTDPFLSYTPPQRGEISNFINRQTKSAWKYVIKLWILLSQPYTLPETNIYKAGMLLCTRRVCIL